MEIKRGKTVLKIKDHEIELTQEEIKELRDLLLKECPLLTQPSILGDLTIDDTWKRFPIGGGIRPLGLDRKVMY